MIKTTIIAEDAQVREELKNLLCKEFTRIHVVGEAGSVSKGIELIEEEKPDLLLLDIDFSDGMGFALMDQIQHPGLNVIFITRYDQHAINAIKYKPLDYLLKPINAAELRDALSRITSSPPIQKYLTEKELTTFLEDFIIRKEAKKLVVRNSNLTTYVKLNEIVRCEADGHYTTIFLQNGGKVVASQALKEYDNLLSEPEFVRIHKSHLVNLSFVRQFSNADGGYVIMEDKARISIARRRRHEFFHRLEGVYA